MNKPLTIPELETERKVSAHSDVTLKALTEQTLALHTAVLDVLHGGCDHHLSFWGDCKGCMDRVNKIFLGKGNHSQETNLNGSLIPTTGKSRPDNFISDDEDMSLRISMHEEKWRMNIENEEWHFNTRAEVEACLKKLLDYKDTKGKLKKTLNNYKGGTS